MFYSGGMIKLRQVLPPPCVLQGGPGELFMSHILESADASESVNPAERYHIVEKLAQGSFAAVYRAQDRELQREVAIKQIHEQFLSDPRQLDRYWAEAQLLASLQHPNIVTIYDIVRDRGWLIMELMQANLHDRQQGRPLDLVSLRTVIAHCLRALKFLHEHGVVHGDLKPGNLMVDRRKRIKLGDFGLARRVSDEEGSLIKGTTKYMAPEIVSDEFGDVGPASDLYSLGFTAYELLCGAHFDDLFPGLGAHGRDKQLAWIMWHAAPDRRLPEIKRVLEGVPDDLAYVIQKLCTKNRAERYESADQALVDLKVDLRPVRGESDTPPPSDEAALAAKKKRRLLIAAFCVSASLSVSMLLIPGESGPPRPKIQAGIVREVRAAQHELVLVDEQTGTPEIVPLGEKPSLLLANTRQKILLEEVQPGDRIRLSGTGPQVDFVLARPISSQGTIHRIDVPLKTLVMHLEEGASREEVPLQIDDQTRILINGNTAPFIDLQPQDRIDVKHLPNVRDENQQRALEVAVRRTVRATGIVRLLHFSTTQPHKLSCDLRQGTTVVSLDLTFDKDAEITLPDQRVVSPSDLTPEDLRTSDRISLEYDTHITKLVATRNQTLEGSLREIDLAQNSVRVQTRGGEQLTLQVTDATEIDITGQLAELDELREYDEARITYQDDGGSLSAATIDATRPIKYDRFAIVIGVQNYHDKAITRPKSALNDAQLVADTLRQRYGVAPERLLILKDPTREKLQQAVTSALEKLRGDTQVLLYFQGQGYATPDGTVYLGASDLKFDQLANTGVPLGWFVEQLDQSAPERKLLLLDAAQTGNGRDLQQQVSTAEMIADLKPQSTTLIASCSEKQRNQVSSQSQQGVFAEAVAQALRGGADPDRDLDVTPQDLLEFLSQALKQPKFENAQPQTPTLVSPSS